MSKLTLYAATSNPGKLRDFAVAASTHDIAVETIPGRIAPPAEDQDSFEGNARDKAIYYSRFVPGELILADDSGVEVDALDGDPGVRSARFAADAGFCDPADSGLQIDQKDNAFLLQRLADVPQDRRTARYRCALALARDGRCLLTSEGRVEGRILTAPQGTGGFGYDPLFYLPDLGLTMAEIDLETKHALSHRGRAFRAMLHQITQL
jgi:XTP/dITP diphosphohydrolase